MRGLGRLLADERGATLIEYIVIVALIAAVAVVAVKAFGFNVAGLLGRGGAIP